MTNEKNIAVQLVRTENSLSPSVAWHLWHCARWADRLQSALQCLPDEPGPDKAREIWYRDSLAKKWGLPAENLGIYEMGIRMDADVTHKMEWPDPASLLEYGRKTTATADKTLDAIADLETKCRSIFPRTEYATIGSDLARYLTHLCRHLGMMEALKGTLGLKGTATT
jgi:hypothetical protein